MRHLSAALMVCAVVSLNAQSTGRISGKITDKAGKPVPEAKVVMTQIDINQTREIKVKADGTYFQVGLNPKEFNIKVTAPGFVDFQDVVKIPLDNVVVKDVTMLTSQEAKGTGVATVIEDPGSAGYNAGREAYESATGLFQAKKFTEAFPLMELAYQNMKEASELAKDKGLKEDATNALVSVERVYAVTAGEVALASPAKKDLFPKIIPILEKHVKAGLTEGKANPKDGNLILMLTRIGKDTGDKELVKKYQPLLDQLVGPQPQIPYNEGVTAFNAGKMKEAREHVMQAISVDAKFPDSYWLLGVLDFASNNLNGAKANLRKYLELAPTGPKAAEVKDMLRELK